MNHALQKQTYTKLPWIMIIGIFLFMGMLTGMRAIGQDAPHERKAEWDGESVDGAWVVNISVTDQAMVNQLANQIDVWSVDHQAGYLTALIDAADRGYLAKRGIDFALDTARMSSLRSLEENRRAISAAGSPFPLLENIPTLENAPATDGIPGYACYRTVEETFATMDSLAATHPNLAQVVDIGDTWDKTTAGGPAGYDIQALVLTNRETTFPKPKFFLVAAVHARELTTSELATRFGEMLVEQYGIDPEITWLLDYAEVHIVPIANPDGRKQAEQGLLWRKNRNLIDGACGSSTVSSHGGVDLNRNSSFKWNECSPGQGCSSSSACAQTFRGPSAASEPETMALESYMSGIFSDTRPISDTAPASPDTAGLMITLHSYSELIIFPWGWSDGPAPNDVELATLGRKFGYFTGYEVCQSGSTNCIYQTDGTTDDWAYGTLGVAAYTFELGTEFFQQCSVFENRILPQNLDALLYAAKAARLPYQLPAGPELVDIDLSAGIVMTGNSITLTVTADDTRFDANGPWGVEPTQTISAARYSVDQPSWITNTQLYSMTAQDGTFDGFTETVSALVDTTGWELGSHTLFVEAQDADGNWGVPSAVDFTIAGSKFDAMLSAMPITTTAKLGASLDYTVTVENLGSASDLYTLTVTSTWPVDLAQPTVLISASESAEIALTVRVPTTATDDLSAIAPIVEPFTVTLQSQGAETLIKTIELTAAATPYRRYYPFFGWER